MVDLSKLAFYSPANYMKQDDSVSGSIPFNLPGPSQGITQIHSVGHNYGYIPFYVVSSTIDDTMTIWSTNIDLSGVARGSATSQDPVILSWTTENTLTISIDTYELNITGTRTLYWKIYRDYGGQFA